MNFYDLLSFVPFGFSVVCFLPYVYCDRSFRLRKIRTPWLWIISFVLYLMSAAMVILIFAFLVANFQGSSPLGFFALILTFLLDVFIIALTVNPERVHRRSGFRPAILRAVLKDDSGQTQAQVAQVLQGYLAALGFRPMDVGGWKYDFAAATPGISSSLVAGAFTRGPVSDQFEVRQGSETKARVEQAKASLRSQLLILVDAMPVIVRDTTESATRDHFAAKINNFLLGAEMSSFVLESNVTLLERVRKVT